MTKQLLEKIDRKDAHLRALTEMSVRMNSRRSTAELMDLVSQETRALVGADRVSIMLVDPLTHQLSIVSSSGVDEDVVATMHLKKGEGIAGKVWEEGKPLLIPDTSSSEDYLRISQKRPPVPATLISVPINDSTEVFGVINAQRPLTAGVYEEEELTRTLVDIVKSELLSAEVCHVPIQPRRPALLSRRLASGVEDSRPKCKSNVACGSYMATSCSKRSSAATICAHAAAESGSRSVAWRQAAFDGVNRRDFFRE